MVAWGSGTPIGLLRLTSGTGRPRPQLRHEVPAEAEYLVADPTVLPVQRYWGAHGARQLPVLHPWARHEQRVLRRIAITYSIALNIRRFSPCLPDFVGRAPDSAAKLLCAPARRKPATPCMRHGCKSDLTERMVAMMKLTLGLLLALALSSCGSTPGQRAVSGGLIGAGVGAGAGALTAPHR